MEASLRPMVIPVHPVELRFTRVKRVQWCFLRGSNFSPSPSGLSPCHVIRTHRELPTRVPRLPVSRRSLNSHSGIADTRAPPARTSNVARRRMNPNRAELAARELGATRTYGKSSGISLVVLNARVLFSPRSSKISYSSVW